MDQSALMKNDPEGPVTFLDFLRSMYVIWGQSARRRWEEENTSLSFFLSGCLMWFEWLSYVIWMDGIPMALLSLYLVVVDCWNLLLISWYPTCVIVEESLIFWFRFCFDFVLSVFLATCVCCVPASGRHRVICFLTKWFYSRLKHWKSIICFHIWVLCLTRWSGQCQHFS